MELVPIKFPTEREIKEVETKLEEMRAKREEAKQLVLQAIKSGEVINSLSSNEKVSLIKQLQASFQGARRKVRGSPVSAELKSSLEEALRKGEHTLSQLEKMFGLSISYISRIKRELGLTNPILNAYEDRPTNTNHPVGA